MKWIAERKETDGVYSPKGHTPMELCLLRQEILRQEFGERKQKAQHFPWSFESSIDRKKLLWN